MYPERLEDDKNQQYFHESEYFCGKFNFVHTYLHKNYKYRMHAHQFYEINLIVSGEGKHYIENTSLDVKAGDVFVIPPETRHGYYSEKELNIYHVLLKKDFLTRYSEEIEEIEGFNILFDIEPNIRKSSGASFNLNVGRGDIDSFLYELEQMISAEKGESYVHLNALTLALLCRLCEKMRHYELSLINISVN